MIAAAADRAEMGEADWKRALDALHEIVLG
jgi:hypothetical protein